MRLVHSHSNHKGERAREPWANGRYNISHWQSTQAPYARRKLGPERV